MISEVEVYESIKFILKFNQENCLEVSLIEMF